MVLGLGGQQGRKLWCLLAGQNLGIPQQGVEHGSAPLGAVVEGIRLWQPEDP